MNPEDAIALFIANTQRLLKESGMTQQQLADNLGVKPPHISRMLNSTKRPPKLDTLAKLAGAFGVDIDELLRPMKPPKKRK